MRYPHPESDFLWRSDEITVYLIHLSRPIHHAQHYIGSCVDLERRMKEHQRKYPLYAFSETSLEALEVHVPPEILQHLEPLLRKKFRRRHTFLDALKKQIGPSAVSAYQNFIFSAARRHTTNGLIMKANREGILWYVAKTWGASREFEMWLKRQKEARKFCPICCGQEEDLPF